MSTRVQQFTAHEQSADRRTSFGYWIAHSVGFSVESPNGRIGLVQDLRSSLDTGEANSLVIRCGKLGRRIMIAPVEEVEAVVPRERRVILRPDPQLSLQPEPPRGTPQLRLIQGGAG